MLTDNEMEALHNFLHRVLQALLLTNDIFTVVLDSASRYQLSLTVPAGIQCASRVTRHRAARMLIMMIMMIMMMLKMTTIAIGRNYLFPEKKVISPLIFSWFLSILGAWEPVLEAWVTFWAQGSDFSDFWDLTAAKVYLHFGPKMTKNRLKIDPKLNKFFDHFFDRLWSPLGTDLVGFWEPKWTQNWSRIGSKSDHEANANIFKFIGRGGVFEDRRCMESIKNRS